LFTRPASTCPAPSSASSPPVCESTAAPSAPDGGASARADRRAPTIAEAVHSASTKAFVILDGTLLPIDRIADLPGAVHDIRAARENGIIDALSDAGIPCWADKGYRGAGGTVRVPYRGRWENLSKGQQAVNRSHAKIRALVEQDIGTLKSWRLLRKLRCSTTRITVLVQTVLSLHLASSG
jgi:hypothetical protein